MSAILPALADFMVANLEDCETEPTAVPELTTITLRPNYPNPFNPRTTITCELDRAQKGELAVYDLHGKLIDILFSGDLVAGEHSVVWHGTDLNGRVVPSGTYLVRLRTESGVDIEKMALMR
jgi:hypothetical protein